MSLENEKVEIPQESFPTASDNAQEIQMPVTPPSDYRQEYVPAIPPVYYRQACAVEIDPSPPAYYGQQGAELTSPVITRASVDNNVTDWQIPSVLSCLFCFFPTGIFAVVYAIASNTYARNGNIVMARREAKTAKILILTTVLLGIACYIAGIIRLTSQSRYPY